MTDDLLDRLTSIDPATDERVHAAMAELGDLPAAISGEGAAIDELAPRRRIDRRRLITVLVAAAVALAVLVPIAFLRGLGDDGTAVGTLPDGWYRVGRLADLRHDVVTLAPEIDTFVVAPAGVAPYALSSVSPHVAGEQLLWCRTSRWFFSPQHGEEFDLSGHYQFGPAPSGMSTLPLRITDGWVDVDPRQVSPGAPRASTTPPIITSAPCHSAPNGYREVRPGVVEPVPSDELPPIVVETPTPDAKVRSPVRIAGTADVFEANVRIQILGGDGAVLADTFTTATCGTGCRGDYSARVPFSVDRRQPGTIVVFEESAQDGSMINAVHIPVTLVLPHGGPTPAPDARGPIRVVEPLVGDVVTSPVTIAGTADVFEAVVSIRIVAGDGTVLADTTTMASCGTGCRGDFSASVPVTVTRRTTATIEVFEVSAKDGSPLHVVKIPVTLTP